MKTKLFLWLFLIISLNTIAHAQINTEKFRKDYDSTGFSASVELEFSANTGNVDFQQLGTGGRINYNADRSYTFLVFKGGVGWTDGKQFSNDALIHLRHVASLNESFQVELFTQFDYNKKRKLNARELIGSGLRYKLYSNDFMKYRIGLAYMYEIEEYELPASSIHPVKNYASRISSYFTFEIKLQDNLSMLSTTYYQPEIKTLSDYRILNDNSVSVVLGKVVDLNIIFGLRYDFFPPDNIKDLDTATKIGLTFHF